MLLVGSGDGVHRLPDASASATTADRVLDSGRVLRVRTFPGLEGAFAATETGLFHTADGESWTDLAVPNSEVYAVAADPGGTRLSAGTRPARVFVAGVDGGIDGDGDLAWREREAFGARSARDDWGIARHDDRAQVRALRVHDGAPDRVVAGVEVGGVYVSDDGGRTWADRSIDGFDAPHTDDVHDLTAAGPDTWIAATGSGLYRTGDAGRTWARLAAGHRQSYFRQSIVHDGRLLAGGSPTPPSSWDEDDDHAMFAGAVGGELRAVSSPTPTEVPVSWCIADGDVVAATNYGSLLRRTDGDWTVVGSVPVPDAVHGRCIPLARLST